MAASLVILAASLGSGILAAGFVSAFMPQDIGAFPLEKVVGLGSGGVVAAVVWIFLRRDDTVRKEHQEAIKVHHDATKSVAAEFAATAKHLSTTFSESTATLLRDQRQLFESFTTKGKQQ